MLAVCVDAGSFSGGKPPAGMVILFPLARPVSISNAFSGFPDMSNHLGDSFSNGALTTQYIAVKTTIKMEKCLHLVMTAATPLIMQMPEAHQYCVAIPSVARDFAPRGSVLRTNDATPMPPQPNPKMNLHMKNCQNPKHRTERPAPTPENMKEAYNANHRPLMSASCPSMPAPKKNPAKNMESASWTFHSSSHMRFHSDTIDAVLSTHSQSSRAKLQRFCSLPSSAVQPFEAVHAHSGIREVKIDISVRNAAGIHAADETMK
mmetsp:Transcript_8136/g.20541  ORF Transcript_8136/g.20541 Transcript_8136/m.20541 type:complete len:262 (-) Transcript_8136:192-977(-)